jgi:hypothetical protein
MLPELIEKCPKPSHDVFHKLYSPIPQHSTGAELEARNFLPDLNSVDFVLALAQWRVSGVMIVEREGL